MSSDGNSCSSTPLPVGLSLNARGGVYENGKAYNVVKKHEIAVKYRELQRTTKPGKKVSCRALGKAAGVSPTTAGKIMKEIEEEGTVTKPVLPKNRKRARGAGSKTLGPADVLLLLRLRQWNPPPALPIYQRWLYQENGTVVSPQVISLWFKTRYEKAKSDSSGQVLKPENI